MADTQVSTTPVSLDGLKGRRAGSSRRADVAFNANEASLDHALVAGEFVVYYQPIVRLIGIPSASPPPVVGAEALLRWNHESNRIFLPSEFLPVLEESPALMCEIGSQVLSIAATKAAEAHLEVSVNVSPLQLFHGDLVKTVERVLHRSSLPPTLLTLEITEQLAIEDLSRAVKVLKRLSALGVQIVADDFDTGCSSLACLYQLPLDGIKLDRTFLAHLPDNPACETTVAAIIGLAHHLGILVTAEGVESDREARVIGAMGFDYAQGYFYGRPAPLFPQATSTGPLVPSKSTVGEAWFGETVRSRRHA